MALFSSKVPQLQIPKKIQIEDFEAQQIELGDSRRQVIAENVRDFEDVSEFIADLNAFNVEQSLDVAELAAPGISNLRDELLSRATELAENPTKVPEAVQRLLTSKAAELGVASGVGLGSEAGRLDLVETFGLAGIEFGERNLARAESLSRTVRDIIPPPSPVNPFQFFSSTQEQQTANQQFEDRRLQADIRLKEDRQQIDQAFENTKAAIANQQAVLDASKRSPLQRAISGITGAVSGFATGGPGGAIAGGLGGAAGADFDVSGFTDLNIPGFRPQKGFSTGTTSAGSR